MALPWLDAARYADSNGFQQDGDTWQWIWRDWLVKALNDDMPFDQFTIRLLAGDLLPEATIEDKIASGFNRNHLLNGEGGAIAEEQRFVNLFDRIDTTATTWLGLTMACAQCHDHKYDPITQRDYYGLLDAFNRVPESGTPQFFSSRIRLGAPFVELPTDENKARIAELEAKLKTAEAESKLVADSAFEGWRLGIFADNKPAEGKGLPDSLAVILRKPEGDRNDEEKQKLDAGLRKQFDDKVRPALAAKVPSLSKPDTIRKELKDYRADQIPRAMIMSDARPRQTAILSRGEYLKPGAKVTFATPAFLPPMPPGEPANRLGLARWLVKADHPLTARVQVNRIWQQAFGAGIVKTAEDFGVQSEYPVHGELLDWLAVEFPSRGWSMKTMHRLIATSATYRQSSRVTPELRTRDLENRLYARAGRFRMSSLILRDWALASSGLLDPRIGGRPVYPYQPDAIWEALAITKERDFTYPASSGKDLYRLSLPDPLGLIRIHRGDRRSGIDRTRRRQRPVSQNQRRHAKAACPRVDPILDVAGAMLGRRAARLAIGRARDDQPMHRLHAPAPRAELDGEPVEQFAVGRVFALDAEILGRLDDPGGRGRADPVDLDAGGQRVVGLDEPSGEPQAVGRLAGRHWRQEGRRREGDLRPRPGVFAARMADCRGLASLMIMTRGI